VVNCGRWIDTHTVVVVRTCTRTVNCVPGNSSVVYSAQRRAVGYMHSAAARRGAVHGSTVQYCTVQCSTGVIDCLLAKLPRHLAIGAALQAASRVAQFSQLGTRRKAPFTSHQL